MKKYLCTNGNNSSFLIDFADEIDAIAAVEYAIKTFDSLGDYILPIQAIDCNGDGARTGWNDEKGCFSGDVLERFWRVRADGTLGGGAL